MSDKKCAFCKATEAEEWYSLEDVSVCRPCADLFVGFIKATRGGVDRTEMRLSPPSIN